MTEEPLKQKRKIVSGPVPIAQASVAFAFRTKRNTLRHMNFLQAPLPVKA